MLRFHMNLLPWLQLIDIYWAPDPSWATPLGPREIIQWIAQCPSIRHKPWGLLENMFCHVHSLCICNESKQSNWYARAGRAEVGTVLWVAELLLLWVLWSRLHEHPHHISLCIHLVWLFNSFTQYWSFYPVKSQFLFKLFWAGFLYNQHVSY